jgi:hypothetical protein
MPLNSTEVKELVHLIRDSFRIRANHDPLFVEIGDSLKRISSTQHQVVFGRRGSGKSCLLVHVLRQCEDGGANEALYVGMDSLKRLPFPDILTRILIAVFEQLPGARRPWWLFFKKPAAVELVLKDLRSILDAALTAQVERTAKDTFKRNFSLSSKQSVDVSMGAEDSSSIDTKEQFRRDKLEYLERHLEDYRRAITDAIPKGHTSLYVLVDDFYLVKRSVQPDVIDYLHRLLRDQNAYLKVGTIRHRTTLRRHEGQTIGVELGQDVEEISLDRTLQTFQDTQAFLVSMLDELGKRVEISNASGEIFNPDAAHALTLASGGVPRDFLNIFADAVDLSVSKGKTDRLTPTYIYKVAASISLQNKRKNLAEDAGVDAMSLEKAFADIVLFCLKEKRKTVFLISRDDAQAMPAENELLQQLMDFKLIHLIDPDTSAASGRAGRFSAYTLDAALFMEPRLRNIEVVCFWEQDDQRRPIGVRESPTYDLHRIKDAIDEVATSDKLDEVLDEVASDHEGQAEIVPLKGKEPQPKITSQQPLF